MFATIVNKLSHSSTRMAALVAVLQLVLVNNGSAGPILVFDSRQGPGQNLYTTQGVHYDAAGAFWAVSAKRWPSHSTVGRISLR